MTEQEAPRHLVVMRHAKAEPYASTDHARRLTDRGRSDARAAGRHLVDAGLVPDHAVVSDAQRTRDTWDEVAAEVGCGDVVRYDRTVYGGGVDAIIEALAVAPAASRTLVLVGHNPTAAHLCHTLDDSDGEPDAVSGLLRGFPTSALVVFEVAVPWADLAPETGRIVDFWAPPR
ncbi:MAG TPA: histidine phosphatase family protein [Nocardioides sp.]|nr:histidine phosphatase family protein [Nocardioides sp.]